MVRKTEYRDLDRVVEIIEAARAYFASVNNPQWQDGYPNRDSIISDIEAGNSYVLEEDGRVIGTAALIRGPEEDYGYIEGAWLNDEPYFVIHRIAVDPSCKGRSKAAAFIAHTAAMALDSGIHNIRIDTHKVNSSMRRFLTKNGFRECGTVYIRNANAGARLAYHKTI